MNRQKRKQKKSSDVKKQTSVEQNSTLYK